MGKEKARSLTVSKNPVFSRFLRYLWRASADEWKDGAMAVVAQKEEKEKADSASPAPLACLWKDPLACLGKGPLACLWKGPLAFLWKGRGGAGILSLPCASIGPAQ